MDISYVTEEGKFNYRVCAVMLHDGKVLAMQDERSPYYYLPGGRVQLGERAEDALTREMREELGIEAKILRPLWLNQAFFTEDVDHLRYHELCLYFLVDCKDSELLARADAFQRQEGRKTLRFTWMPIEQLEKTYFYPTFLKKEIFHLPETLTLRVETE